MNLQELEEAVSQEIENSRGKARQQLLDDFKKDFPDFETNEIRFNANCIEFVVHGVKLLMRRHVVSNREFWGGAKQDSKQQWKISSPGQPPEALVDKGSESLIKAVASVVQGVLEHRAVAKAFKNALDEKP